MALFHAQVSTHASTNGFMFDLDEVGVVRDLVLPIFNQDDVILDGKQISMKRLDRCKIVVTKDRVQPRIKEWYESQTIKLSKPQEQFADKTKFFDVELDVSNALFQEMKRSSELEEIRVLLREQQRIKETLAQQPAEAATGAREALADTSVRIATIVGAFVGAMTGGWMNTQQ
jgi:hypothetical protein